MQKNAAESWMHTKIFRYRFRFQILQSYNAEALLTTLPSCLTRNWHRFEVYCRGIFCSNESPGYISCIPVFSSQQDSWAVSLHRLSLTIACSITVGGACCSTLVFRHWLYCMMMACACHFICATWPLWQLRRLYSTQKIHAMKYYARHLH